MHLSPPVGGGLKCKAVVLLLLTCCLFLLPLWESVIVLCFVVPSSFEIILMGKRELVPLLGLSSWCLVIVVWLFLTVPWVCLQFVIVVFPDHTHYFCDQLYVFFSPMGVVQWNPRVAVASNQRSKLSLQEGAT